MSTIKASAKTTAQQEALAKASPSDKKPAASPAAGTYEVASTETIEPIAPGAVRVVSPAPDEVTAGAALEVAARVAEGWSVSLEVEGSRIPESNIGERRVDHKNKVSTFTYVAVNLQPGPNRIRVTAISPEGKSEGSVDLTAYGRGPAKRLEVTAAKSVLSAGGRDSTTVRVRAFDNWGHPAADASVAIESSAGRLLREGEGTASTALALTGAGTDKTGGVVSEQVTENMRQQIVQLVGGEGTVQFIADNAAGEAEIRASIGTIETHTEVRITPEERAAILVGLAEMSVGRAAPEIALSGEDTSARSRVAFFYRGQVFGKNLLTLAYDSRRALNRTAANDRLFQLDPLERAYPLFGDSSTRYEDAQSNSKLYARLDRGRSYFMFGDFETELKDTVLATYSRKLTGVKVHLENSRGDFVSLTGARPDTSFARDIFPGGALGFATLSHPEVLPGSEVVTLEVRDRRNPEIIISREQLVRSVDYNFDTVRGEIFFLRPISAFDYALNLTQIVVTYEHRASGMSSAVYTGRAVKNFEKLGLRLGLSFVNQRQADLGSFFLGGVDGEKKLPGKGILKFEWATSRGRVAAGGNVFDSGDAEHNGNAYRVELEQPLPFKEAIVKADFARADEGFLNPFGGTIAPGSQRASVALDMKVRPSSVVRFGLMDERNRTANVDNERVTASINWAETLTDRLRVNFGYDLRHLSDDFNDRETTSNLVTVGAEWQATDKLQLSVKREQNLGEADPTYPNQTTFAANYKWNSWTRVFLTQRLASAPIVPISDVSATGFASSGARRETAIGVETKLGRYTSLASRYQIENGINGTDSFAVIGLTNRLPITKKLSLDLGYERGFHLAGEGQSFNSATLGFAWQPTENFRTSGRYELRDRGGVGHVLTFGAAGRLADNLTSLVRVQTARTSFNERDNKSTGVSAALAWRPVESDRAGLLFSYTHRDVSQEGGAASVSNALRGATRDRADVLSSDGYLQATKKLELYGRFALKFGDTTASETPRVSALTFMTQARAAYRLGRYFDLAGETRLLAQPSTGTRRASYGAEAGFWALADLRLGLGYNFTKATEPFGVTSLNPRRGFYFTMSSKLSNLFDLFGTSREGLQATEDGGGAKGTTGDGKKEEKGEQ